MKFKIPKSTMSSVLAPFSEVRYAEPKLDFEIDPDHFVRWLKEEKESVSDDYKKTVSDMCEYSCLYIAMLLEGRSLKGELRIYDGNFGYWEHFWIGYKIDRVEWFIDLTLCQFVSDAPRLSISGKIGSDPTAYKYNDEYAIRASEYLERKRAFDFYTDPRGETMSKPRVAMPDFMESVNFNVGKLKDAIL